MEGSCKLIATLRSHRLVLGVVEGMQRQMLNFEVILMAGVSLLTYNNNIVVI